MIVFRQRVYNVQKSASEFRRVNNVQDIITEETGQRFSKNDPLTNVQKMVRATSS